MPTLRPENQTEQEEVKVESIISEPYDQNKEQDYKFTNEEESYTEEADVSDYLSDPVEFEEKIQNHRLY